MFIPYRKIFLLISCFSVAAHAESAIDLTDLTGGDPFYYTSNQNITEDNGQSVFMGTGRPYKTHSQIPHLPVYSGYMNTNYTYRFINVAEQVFTMIGEGKHGVWRTQEKGIIREYLKPNATGLKEGSDLYSEENQKIIADQYVASMEDRSALYYYPDEMVNESGHLTYIDLPITHPKYKDKYKDHVPIDLANFYCTMSGPDFPYSRHVMDYSFAQEGANQIGPLGKRAGLDIKENYTKVLRLEHFPDASSWVNVGIEGKDDLHVKWKAVDTTKTEAEYYIFERPFFGVPYLFLTVVFDNKDNQDFQYVRPDGPYYESLLKANVKPLKTEVTMQPRFHLKTGGVGKAIGLPLYGVHHPNRAAFGAGGACPLKGGDWGRYPDVSGGASWPTTYEEVTPLCDTMLIDLKFYSNLDGRDWTDEDKYLANAGVGSTTVDYTIQPGEYGVFSEEYNVSRDYKNPDSMKVPEKLTITFPASEKPVSYTKVEPAKIDKSTLPALATTCRPVQVTSN